MALKSENIELKVFGGLQENADSKQLDLPNVISLDNCVLTNEGKISKRQGAAATSVPENFTGFLPSYLLLNQGRPSVVTTAGDAFSYGAGGTFRQTIGTGLPPGEISVTTFGPTEESSYDYDSASNGTYTLQAWRRYDAGLNAPVLWFQLMDAYGSVVYGPRMSDDGTAPLQGYPRVVYIEEPNAVGTGQGKFMVFAGAENDVSTKDPIKAGTKLYYFVVTPAGADSTVSAIVDTGVTVTVYDATCARDNSLSLHTQVAVAYHNAATNNVGVKVYGLSAGTLSLLGTVNGTSAPVATVTDNIAICLDATLTKYFLVSWKKNAPTTITSFYGNLTTPTINAGSSVTVYSGGLTPNPNGLIIHHGNNNLNYVKVAYSIRIGTNPSATSVTTWTSLIEYDTSMSNQGVVADIIPNFCIGSKALPQENFAFAVNHSLRYGAAYVAPVTRSVWSQFPVSLLVESFSKSFADPGQGTNPGKRCFRVRARFNQGRSIQSRPGYASHFVEYFNFRPGPIGFYAQPSWNAWEPSTFSPAAQNPLGTAGTQYHLCCTVATAIKTRRIAGNVYGDVGTGNAQTTFGGANVYYNATPLPLKTLEVQNGITVATGSNPGIFDSWQPMELAPHYSPCNCVVTVVTPGVSLTANKYAIKVAYEYTDAFGNLHRSCPSLAGTLLLKNDETTSQIRVTFPMPPISSLNGDAKQEIVCVIYSSDSHGTTTSGTGIAYGEEDAKPFFEVMRGIPTALTDEPSLGYMDFSYTVSGAPIQPSTYGPALYTNSGELTCDPPTPLLSLCSDGSRLHAISGEFPSEVRQSKIFVPGYAPEFNDNLYVRVPMRGGRCVAVESMDDKIIVFKDSAIYYYGGQGPNNLGQGSFSPVYPVTFETGCSQSRSVISVPDGIMFVGKRGWYKLKRDLTVDYVGKPVETSMANKTVACVTHLPARSEIRVLFTDQNYGLVYNYLFDAWSRFINDNAAYPGIAGLVVDGAYARLLTTGQILTEDPNIWQDNGISYGQTIVTPWIKPAGLQGFLRVRRVKILGECNFSTSSETFSFYTGINYKSAYDVIKTWTQAQIAALSRFQLEVHQPYQKCESIRFLFSETGASKNSPGFTISSIMMEVARKGTSFRHLPDGAKK